jgi:hypothetical protein
VSRQGHDQLPLLIDDPEFRKRVYRISRKAHRKRLPVLQPRLPVPDKTFQPIGGVPKTRADCPTERPCVFVRCKWHLFREDADHRAGRPGLSSVPRDERGLTLATPGDAGDDRAGTTLRPAWLHVRGLELEREVKVYVADGELLEVRNGTLDYWLARLHVGEPVLVFNDNAEVIAKGKLRARGEFMMDREIPSHTSEAVVLTRVREVSSCALDLIDRCGEISNEKVGDAVGRHRTLVGREVRRATGKMIERAAEIGMSESELMRGIAELRRQNGR